MRNLEKMQKLFIECLKEAENLDAMEEFDLKDSIEKKLIEIANNNDYELFDKSDLLGKNEIFLVFQNKMNQKYISAWINKDGFNTKELVHLW